jgi:hypothetical protein
VHEAEQRVHIVAVPGIGKGLKGGNGDGGRQGSSQKGDPWALSIVYRGKLHRAR